MTYYIIGERELVIGFSLVGVPGMPVNSYEEARNVFLHVTGQSVGADTKEPVSILILTEAVSLMLEKEVQEWQLRGDYPLIVEIPGLQGAVEGKKTLTDSIREAIGIRA